MATVTGHLSPELAAQVAAMRAERGLPTLGFYEALTPYPALFECLEALGTFVRFHSVLPVRIREIAVLIAAVEQRSAFEWQTHEKTSTEAGVTPALKSAIVQGTAFAPEDAALEDVRATVRCVVRQESVPQAVFDRLHACYGLQGAVELVTLAAMYRMYAALGAAFDSTMPGAGPPPWEHG
ncbi:MAG: carboxymuconolactone decarboxylase family protein [Armatimonadetes bacterium]|nr:carboxymuconolactone decarboxylase family protein [Armatimonadota bacterium]